jgi:hypothetical protein
MDTRITAVLLAAAVAGGGYAGWKLYSELGRLRVEVVNTKQALEQAKTEARVTREKAVALQKDLDEQKIQVTALTAERDSARVLQQAALRHSERMQQDLLLAQQQIAYLRARAGVSATQGLPQLAPQRPMIIQALPAPRPQGAAVAAPVPGQGYGGRQ